MTPPDTLNSIGVLTRREIEARLLAPLIDAFAQTTDRAQVIATVRDTIADIARTQGADMARAYGEATLTNFADSLKLWTKDDALIIDIIEQSPTAFGFNVTRCRYAELYTALGLAELGAVFSCNRDAALIEGFSADIRLTRTQTIMEGAPFCDFRYRLNQPSSDS
jgi:hypothetical protein